MVCDSIKADIEKERKLHEDGGEMEEKKRKEVEVMWKGRGKEK